MADLVRYVNTDNSSSGDGTTNETDGSADSAYTDLISAVDALETDLVSDGDTMTIYVNGSAEDTITGSVNLDGWTTGASNRLTIEMLGGEEHGGVWNTGTYRIAKTNSGAIFNLDDGVEYLTIRGLQIDHQNNPSTGSQAIDFNNMTNDTSSDIIIEDNIIRESGTGTPGAFAIGIRNPQRALNISIVNNIIYGNWNDAIQMLVGSVAVTQVLYNNTIDGAANDGIAFDNFSATATVRLFNNFVQNCTTSDYDLSANITTGTNGSGDSTSPDGASYQSMSPSFVNETAGSEDFHLTAATPESGTDLSSDSDYAFSTDIDGDTRSTWDLGADEYISSQTVTQVAQQHARRRR